MMVSGGGRSFSCLGQDGFEERKAALEVHVVAHALGLPAVDGRVRPETCLKLLPRQQVHPYHLYRSLIVIFTLCWGLEFTQKPPESCS